MNKAVMISMQPKWCELIASGKKTIEVRKTAPKDKEPFKVYIYQTKKKWIYRLLEKLGLYQGKVIGECVCDKVYDITPVPYYEEETGYKIPQVVLDGSCLFAHDIITYLTRYDCRRNAYGWHISDLKIYDKPKELGEFYTVCHKLDCDQCGNCPHLRVEPCSYPCDDSIDTWCSVDNCKPLARPPQSWMYVEEVCGE